MAAATEFRNIFPEKDTVLLPLVHLVEDSRAGVFFLFLGVSTSTALRKVNKFCSRSAMLCTCCPTWAQGCSTAVAVGKDELRNLPRMSATHALVIRIAVGDLPTLRHVHRLFAIFNFEGVIDFVRMQCHVDI
jgi:hypothetical protein